jgi:eukaryotic-like serine/threonine-protein kinase
MTISVADFWRLLVESRLLTADEARQAADELARAKPQAANDLQQIAKGLLQAGKLSRYQAKILLSGKPGPFVYGDYVVYDRFEIPRLSSLFRARHLPTRHGVGLLFLTGPASENSQNLIRLMPQVAIAHEASHAQPRLSGCYQFADHGAFKFLVVEDLRGDSLEERLKKPEAKISLTAACRLVRLTALGLAQLHSLGQAHGHVRPANIWLDEAGAAKLLQFPLIADPLAAKKPPASVDAQLDYLAPELAAPGAQADARSDVYSLGCLLFTLLAGHPPLAQGDRQAKLARLASEATPSISKFNSQVPAALAQVLNYLLQKDAAKRYPDAAAVAEALQAYSGADPQTAIPPTLVAYEAWLKRPADAPSPAATPQAATPAVRSAAVANQPVGANGGNPARGLPTAQPAAPRAAATVTAQSPAGQAAFSAGAMPVAAAVQPARATGYAIPSAQPMNVAAPVLPAVQVAGPVVNPVTGHAPAGASAAAYRRPKKPGQTAATAGVVVCAVLLLAGIVWILQSQNKTDAPIGGSSGAVAATQSAGGLSTAAATKAVADSEPLDAHLADNDSAVKEPVQGIGQPIWQSPTEGSPLNLAWLPPGVQVVLAMRLAELTRQDEWERLIDAKTLGTMSQWLTEDLPKLTGKPLDQLESVIVGLLDGSPGPPRVALVSRAIEEFSLDELRAGWLDIKPEEIEGQVIHSQSDKAFYLPASGADKLLVIAPAVELREMLKTGGEAPALRREVEVLAESSDDQRHLTLLAAPNFPLTDGKGLFIDEGAKLLEPLRIFLEVQDSDGKLELPKALLFSCHLSDRLFVELRLYDNFGKPAQTAAREFQRRIAKIPKDMSGYVRDLQLSAYSKPILWDYKEQLDVLQEYTRLGVEGKQIVLRAYLPSMATHNLALGAHLALLENPGDGAPAAATASKQPSAKPQTVVERLAKKTSLSFPRNTLEQSLKLLGDDIGVEIVILGNDLRDEGITKNQSFGLDEKDQPAVDILRKIMKLANPDGKLVYVIKPKEGGGEDVLYVTTRAAVKKRGDKLPPELESAK